MLNQSTILMATVFLASTTHISVATAATKSVRQPTITMKAGTKTGLQEVFSWDGQCKTVKVSVAPSVNALGAITIVRDQFVISQDQSAQCAGKTVSGYRVVFNARLKGNVDVKYTIRSKALPHTYVVSRTMQIN